MADPAIFEAGDFRLQSGATLAEARLAYATHGTLSPARDNVVVFPTRVGGTHADNEYLIGPGRALDPERYFIVVPNMLGNGLSSSPSNARPPHDGPRFPAVSHYDNVTLQHRLLTERLGVERVALAVGFSMGGQQAYHWAALHPGAVERLCAICCLARTTPHAAVFVEGLKAAMAAGATTLARVWAGWGLSQAFYREERYRAMGFETVDDFLTGFWEPRYAAVDADDMLAMLTTWRQSDIGANPLYGGDTGRALAAIRARSLVMPCRTDLYFPPEDSEVEAAAIPNAEFRPIPSVFGHFAGGGANPDDTEFIDAALKKLLSRP